MTPILVVYALGLWAAKWWPLLIPIAYFSGQYLIEQHRKKTKCSSD